MPLAGTLRDVSMYDLRERTIARLQEMQAHHRQLQAEFGAA